MATFLGLPHANAGSLGPGDIGILGAPDCTPYVPGAPSHSQEAPAAIRAASTRHADRATHYDFDWDAPLLDPAAGAICDLGDVACDPTTPVENRAAITRAVADVLRVGAHPLVLGGDDSVPIPMFAAFEEVAAREGPVWVLQIDAHLDWREERHGERLGWSSPMRRASEMPWIAGMVQVGLRGVGTARPRDLADARSWGARIFTARTVHEAGIAAAAEALPVDARVVISLDCDGLEPAQFLGVMAREPGGLGYGQVVTLFQEVSRRARVVGGAILELAPQRDPSGLSALTASRLVCAMIHAIHQPLRRSRLD